MVVVSKKFVMGLASYLLQASLSIDRIPREDMAPLIEFNKLSRYSLQDVLARLKQLNHGRCPENKFQESIRWSIGEALIIRTKICLQQLICIEYPRLCLVEIALQHYEQLHADKSRWSRKQFVNVRLEIAYTGALIEPLIHPRFVREATYKVDHLNHAEHLKVKSVEEIAGQDWLGVCAEASQPPATPTAHERG